MTVKEQQESLLKLLQDNDFHTLSQHSKELNIFSILKISKTEIRHSNMLAWLMNPNESHGLGNEFLRRYLSLISSRIVNEVALKLLTAELNTFQVYREYPLEKYPIDLLFISKANKFIIAIENKVGSRQHNAGKSSIPQLKAYKDGIEAKFKEYSKLYLFLTPDGDIPEGDDQWIVTSYKDILDVLENIYQQKMGQLEQEVNLLISNYIKTIKKEIVMDDEITQLCRKIYNAHQDALELIFENKEDMTSIISGICKEYLEKYTAGSNSIEIQVDNDLSTKSLIKFRTTTITQHFQECTDIKPENYYYQLEIKRESLRMVLVYYRNPTGFNKETLDKMNEFLRKKIKKEDTWTWKSQQIGESLKVEYSEATGDAKQFTEGKIQDWIDKQLQSLLTGEKK